MRSFAYQYNVLGMITNLTREDSEQVAYTYDCLSRLTGEEHLDSSTTSVSVATWQYDLAGNRTNTVEDGQTNTCAYGVGNRMSHVEDLGTEDLGTGE